MLRPFQIRDLSVSPLQEEGQGHEVPAEASPPAAQGASELGTGVDHHDQEKLAQSGPSPAVVQLSALDYDDLARNHPRARLTYEDVDDDGDTITVGSSLELAQRLTELIDTLTEAESLHALRSMRPSQDDASPMHIFDIRRSASVTDLWKRFEDKADVQGSRQQEGSGVAAATQEPSETPTDGNAAATSAPGDEPQPLLAAFEAELAEILSTTGSSQNRSPRPESPPTVEPSATASPGRTPHPIEILVAQVLRQLINGAGTVQSELRTRMPELQRQLHHAQQSLPENVGTSLQAVLTALENHMRNLTGAFHDRFPDGGRQFAEEAIHAGRPVAENAAENLRMLASEFNEAGRTLFAAFENEFRRPATGRQNRSTAEAQVTEPHSATQPSASTQVPPRANDESHGGVSDETEKETSNSSQPEATPSDAQGFNDRVQREGPSNSTCAPSGPHQPPHYYPNAVPAASSATDPWAPPPFGQPPRHAWSGMPRFSPYAPPPPYPGRPWPFQWHPMAPNTWPAPRHGPANHGPPNLSGAPPNPSVSAHLNNAGTQTSSANRILFIGNVGFKVTETMIEDVFASKGFLVKAELPKDTVSGKHAGFGYVKFPSVYPAMAAMEALQGVHIDGHAINLEFSDQSPIESVSASQSATHDMGTVGRNATTSHSNTGSNDEQTAGHQDSTSRPWSSTLPTRSASDFSNKRSDSTIRRKAVAFDEPTSSANVATAGKAENGNGGLLDSTSDEPAFTARFPSLLPEGRPQHHISASKQEILPSLSSEPEMARFPPVSQLEAHLLADQRKGRSGPPNVQTLNNRTEAKASHESQATPESLPRNPQTAPDKPGPQNLGAHMYAPRPLHHFGHGLRRSNTMTFAPSASAADKHGPGELKRRATERQSLRSSARRGSEMDTWARISRRERNRALPTQSIPGSVRIEPAQPPVPSFPTVQNRESSEQADPIEQCVSLLLDMGYGTVENGGPSRMAVYAAAADGDLLDAIEMIEEERKAYKRHSRS